MKYFSYFTFTVLFFLVVSSLPSDISAQEANQASENKFFKENVVFADARVRSLSKSKFVKEVVLISYSKKEKLPPTLTFDGTSFFDDGSYNDLRANDGVYTSAAQFSHSANVPFFQLDRSLSIMNEVITDNSFLHKEKLVTSFDKEYKKPKVSSGEPQKGGGPKFLLDCDIQFGVCGCRADEYGWCDCCCFSTSNCHFVGGWG